MIFKIANDSVQIIDDGGVTKYFALLDDFLTDINDGEFSFGLPLGVGGFWYDTRRGPEPLRVFTDANGRDFPFPTSGQWPLIDSLLARSDELAQKANARAVMVNTVTQQTLDQLARSIESINPADAIQAGRLKPQPIDTRPARTFPSFGKPL